MLFEIVAALLKLFGDDRWDEWICVDLAMRMMKRDTDGFALVLENEDVFYKCVLFQFLESVSPDTNELMNAFDRLGCERRIMIG